MSSSSATKPGSCSALRFDLQTPDACGKEHRRDLAPHDPGGGPVCGADPTLFDSPEPDNVTCGRCRRTVEFRRAVEHAATDGASSQGSQKAF